MRGSRGFATGFAVLAALAGAAIAGCGVSSHRTPSLAGLPVVSGARVEVSKRTCDRGANAYCSLQVVLVGGRYRTSAELLAAEQQLLSRRHWSDANAPVGLESAADAPHDRLRVVYATAFSELQAVDQRWIWRSKQVALALSDTVFAHEAALSILLRLGTGA